MNKINRFLISLASLVLFSGVALNAPVAAHDGTSGSGSGSHDSTEVATTASNETEAENQAKDLAEQFQSQAHTQLAEDRAKVKEQTKEHKDEKEFTARICSPWPSASFAGRCYYRTGRL
jgi:hypothetical protein